MVCQMPPPIVWQPRSDAWESSQIGRFLQGVGERHGLRFDDYEVAWRWSVDHLPEFWTEVVNFFGIEMTSSDQVLTSEEMPGARWFPGARLNYVDQMLDWDDQEAVALIARSQTRPGDITLTMGELREQVGAAAAGLKALGVRAGDRVVAYLPNIPEALIAFLATASIGAILVVLPPRVRDQERGRSFPPDRAQSASGRRRLPPPRSTHRPESSRSPRSGPPCPRWSTRCRSVISKTAGTGTISSPSRQRFQLWPFRLTIPSMSSIPPAPPVCPSRSSTDTAESRWSTAKRSDSNTGWVLAIDSSGTPPPAG